MSTSKTAASRKADRLIASKGKDLAALDDEFFGDVPPEARRLVQRGRHLFPRCRSLRPRGAWKSPERAVVEMEMQLVRHCFVKQPCYSPPLVHPLADLIRDFSPFFRWLPFWWGATQLVTARRVQAEQ
jgi:hypothetical protein